MKKIVIKSKLKVKRVGRPFSPPDLCPYEHKRGDTTGPKTRKSPSMSKKASKKKK